MMISQEIESVRKLLEDFKPREYLYFAEEPTPLFNVFIGRLLFCHCNEASLLRQGLMLKERINHLRIILYCAKEQLPPFTLPGFMNHEPNVVYFQLNQQPEGTSGEDYFLMRDWENQQKRECISLAGGILTGRLMEPGGACTAGRELMHAEVEQLGLLFDHARQWTLPEFMSRVSKLKGLPEAWMPRDAAPLHEAFCLFSEEQWIGQSFAQGALETALQALERDQMPSATWLCWAMAHYRRGLTRALNGTREETEPDDQLLFAQTCGEGLSNAAGRIGEMKKRILLFAGNRKEIQWILSHEMKQLRPEFNRLTHTGYFRFLPEPGKLQSYFVNHCFLAKDRAVHQWQLSKAIELDQLIRFLEAERFKIHPQKPAPSFHLPSLQRLFNGLLSSMMPDGGLVGEVEEVFAGASRSEMERKPQQFIRKELTEAIGTLCHHAVKKLKAVLDSQPTDRKLYFAGSQLKELGYLKISAQGDGQELCPHIENVMAIYQLEKESGLIQPDAGKFKIINLLQGFATQVVQPQRLKVLAFNLKNIKDDSTVAVMNYLIKNGAIPKETTIAHFNSKFNGMNGTDPIEWLAPMGDLATFIKELRRIAGPEFAPYNQHLNIAAICFVQKGGNPFDPQKLRCSKPTMLEPNFLKAARKIK